MSNRARNFIIKFYNEKNLELIDNCKWYTGQEEINDYNKPYIKLCIAFQHQRTISSLYKKYSFCHSIEITNDVFTSINNCTLLEKRTSNNKVFTFGNIPSLKNKLAIDTLEILELLTRANEANSFDEAMKMVELANINYFICNKNKLIAHFTSLFAQPDYAKFPITSFNHQPIDLEKIHKTVVFVGPSNIGKTQFALAHFKSPVLVRDKEDWAKFNADKNDGIVMDDVNFTRFSSNKVIHILEMDTAVKQDIKYSSVTIPANTKKIICVNSILEIYPYNLKEYHRPAIERRIEIFNFTKKLFDVNVEIIEEQQQQLIEQQPSTYQQQQQLIEQQPSTSTYQQQQSINLQPSTYYEKQQQQQSISIKGKNPLYKKKSTKSLTTSTISNSNKQQIIKSTPLSSSSSYNIQQRPTSPCFTSQTLDKSNIPSTIKSFKCQTSNQSYYKKKPSPSKKTIMTSTQSSLNEFTSSKEPHRTKISKLSMKTYSYTFETIDKQHTSSLPSSSSSSCSNYNKHHRTSSISQTSETSPSKSSYNNSNENLNKKKKTSPSTSTSHKFKSMDKLKNYSSSQSSYDSFSR